MRRKNLSVKLALIFLFLSPFIGLVIGNILFASCGRL